MSERTIPDASASGPPTGSRRRRVLAGLTAATLVATTASILTAGTAFAVIPTAPDNLLVFPNRDFITIEGYQSHKGEVATLEVTRGGQVVGSAQGTVSGDDVAFEVNHPGGVCWGNGTTVKVTPDIQPGDTATIKFGGTAFGDTTVQSAGFANDPAGVPTPTMSLATSAGGQTDDTLIVEGTIDPANNAPDPVNMEQRIVNPDGFRTNLGKRDIRAVPGPLTASAKAGTSTYSSMLENPTPTTFKATYVFSDPAVAAIAKDGGGQRLLQWQQVDAAANRQGVTIAEAGEVGGPGFGGCPAGPAQAPAPTPGSASVLRSTDKASAKVTWSPATAQPGAAAVTGYSIEAINTVAGANGRPVIGSRTDATATSVTIGGLDPAAAYDFELRSLAGTAMSAPFTATTTGATPPGTPPATPAPANLVITPKGGPQATPAPASSVTATAANGYQIYYTDDGSLAAGVDGPSNTAKLYGGPITITAPVQLHIVAYDGDGNLGQSPDDGYYAPGATVPAPLTLKATGGQGQVTLTWAAVTGATGYQVKASTVGADGVTLTPLAPQPPASTGTSQVVTGLETGKYSFTVTAKNAGGAVSGDSPAATADVTAVTDTVSIGKVTWKAGQQLRVVGSDTLATGSITILAAVQDASGNWVIDTTKPALISNVQLASAAPAAGSTFDARGATTNTRPAVRVIARSSGGGVSPAVAVP
jgi:hypothetical protein